MSENKITIIAESFEAAALEFHRSKLSSKGYRMDGKITSQKFESITLERLEIDLDSKTSVSRAIFFIICWLAKMGNLF